jgi:hypothetical protein
MRPALERRALSEEMESAMEKKDTQKEPKRKSCRIKKKLDILYRSSIGEE